jgi:hypothetical protein
MIDFRQDPKSSPAQSSLESWTIAIATALVAFILLGVLPHVQW